MRTERGTWDRVLDACERAVRGEPAGLASETRLADLGLDSLGTMELALAVEERLGVRLADADEGAYETVGEVLAAVAAPAPPRRPRVSPGLGEGLEASIVIAGRAVAWHSRLEVTGREYVPRTGPLVVAPCHRGMLDIPLIALAVPRHVYFLTKIGVFQYRPVARLLHELGGFTVDQATNDVRALDTCLAILERGDALVVYPEGERSQTGEMKRFHGGAAWLAMATAAPIVPCGITGSASRSVVEGWTRRKRVTVRLGPSLRPGRVPDPSERLARVAPVTEELRSRVAHLV